MLTDAERNRIYEEEAAKRQVPSPTDQLSSCIMQGCTAVVVLIGIAVAIFVGLLIKGALWPVY